MNKIICIYKIQNVINNKVYIGQTINYKNRIIKHKYDLRNFKNASRHLQNAWNKYGEENFIFEIIETCLKEELNEKEKYYIRMYDSISDGYNIEGGGQINKKLSDETKRLMSINNPRAWKNKKWGEHNISKEIHQYDKNGNYIRSFGNAYHAAEVLNVDSGSIQYSVNNNNRSGYGFQWSYEKKDNVGEYIRIKAKIVNEKKVNMICLITNKILMTFDSATKAQRYLGLGKNKISDVCKNKRKSWGGYKWSYA